MKIAYCIICHEISKILIETVNYLSKYNDIYIHIDKKNKDLNSFLIFNSNVKILNNRVNVSWGSFSQVEVMIKLLKETLKKNYDYISLISGDDLPMKSNLEIKEFLQKNKGKEFMGVQKEFINLDNRVKYKYNKYYFEKNRSFYIKILIFIQKKLKLYKKNEFYKNLPKLYKGSQWFTISSNLRDYILDYLKKNPNYIKSFEHSYCSDEIFFQTIVCNSKYKKALYWRNENNDNLMALRYIDWNSGPDFPKLLNETDFEKIKKTDCIFARKFYKNLNLKMYRDYFMIK